MIKFNDWSIIEQQGKYWLCECVCGNIKHVVGYDVRTGKSKCCGCKRKLSLPLAAKIKNTTHGISDQTEQRIWSDMKRRCYNQKRKDFSRYGARGITVCDRWLNGDGQNSGFVCFLNDMGRRPSKDYTLDRKDNNRGYSPENCRWATKVEQSYNKKNTFVFFALGRTWNLEEASRFSGVKSVTIYQRVHIYKMSGAKAMELEWFGLAVC